MLLLRFGLIRRSFADYDEWEKQAIPDSAPAAATPNDGPDTAATVTSRRGLAAAVLAVVLVFVAAAAATTIRTWDGVPVWSGPLAGLLAGPIIAAAVLRRFNRGSSDSAASPAHAWIQYPHARREMFKELAFLAPCVVLGYLGGTLASGLSASPPLWLVVLAGTLMGYLIGGGVVWAIRIFGSLFFGKEAMGLGDVHLMAAVGACVGWIDATLAFPLAAVVGLYSVVVSRVASGNLARAMPFGPYLAAATVLVLLCKPLIEQGLTYLLAIPPDLPGVNIP